MRLYVVRDPGSDGWTVRVRSSVRPGIGMDRPYSSRDSTAAKRSGSLRVQTKEAGRDTNCARSLPSEHFSSSSLPRSGQPGHKASSKAMRCDGMRGSLPPSLRPSMRYHAENNKAQAERVRQLQALHESWLAYRTAAPTTARRGREWSGVAPSLPAARSFFQAKREEVGNRRKRARTRTEEAEVGWGQGSGKSSKRCRSTSAPPYQNLPL